MRLEEIELPSLSRIEKEEKSLKAVNKKLSDLERTGFNETDSLYYKTLSDYKDRTEKRLQKLKREKER